MFTRAALSRAHGQAVRYMYAIIPTSKRVDCLCHGMRRSTHIGLEHVSQRCWANPDCHCSTLGGGWHSPLVRVETIAMTRRPSHAPLLAMLVIVAVSLAAYVGGYFGLGKRMEVIGLGVDNFGRPYPYAIERSYPQRWMATIYQPAGWAEERVRGVNIEIREHDR